MDILSRSGDIRNQSRTLQKNRPKFCMFLAPPVFFWGALPEFLDLDYKVEVDSDNVAKFRGDRPRELGDWALNKKKTSRAEHKPVRNGGSGRPNEE